MSHDPNALGATRPDTYKHDEPPTNSKYLPLLKLFASTSKPVQKGLASPGTFGVSLAKETLHKFGSAIDCLIFGEKNMAIDMSKTGAPVRAFDCESAEYKAIAARADNGRNTGCQYGTVFLIWERTLGIPMEFFCGNPSSRMEVPGIEKFMPLSDADIKKPGEKAHWALPCTLTATLIDKPTMSFFVPVASKCSVPFANQPTLAEAQAMLAKFLYVEREIDAPAQHAR